MLARLVAIAIVIAGALPAAAQTVVDDTAANVDPVMLQATVDALGGELRDPLSAQLRGLRQGPSGICGEVNATNGFGGFVGFRQFAYTERRTDVADNGLRMEPINRDEPGASLVRLSISFICPE